MMMLLLYLLYNKSRLSDVQSVCIIDLCIFFFFQAEDGIRDWSVTGVQTCALPISLPPEADRAVRFGGQRKIFARSGPYRGSIHSTCLPLVTDRAIEAWYHPSIA